MGAKAKLSFEEFARLPELEGAHYELDEGELLMEASPAARHNLARQRIALQLMQFVEAKGLGIVLEETDFRLGPNTVRNPDVAFVTVQHLEKINLDRSPIDGAPALAVEVISPTNATEDIARKTRQYLNAGSRSVWLVYPNPGMLWVEVHTKAGVRRMQASEQLREETLLPGFALSLRYVFEGRD